MHITIYILFRGTNKRWKPSGIWGHEKAGGGKKGIPVLYFKSYGHILLFSNLLIFFQYAEFTCKKFKIIPLQRRATKKWEIFLLNFFKLLIQWECISSSFVM